VCSVCSNVGRNAEEVLVPARRLTICNENHSEDRQRSRSSQYRTLKYCLMCQQFIMELERCCRYHSGHPDWDSSWYYPASPYLSHTNFHFDSKLTGVQCP